MTDPLLLTLKHALGGDISGRTLLAPSFGHPPKDRGTSITISPSSPGGLLVNVFNGTPHEALITKDRCLAILGQPRPVHNRADRVEPYGNRHDGEPIDDTQRIARALSIWDEARTPIASPVEKYLARRGVGLPEDPRDVIRFHPACPFAGSRTRAMVALVRDIVSNEPVAIHRTALDLAGTKIAVNGKDRLALGPIRNGAVKLTADENVTLALGVGEGIETALSLKGLPEFGDSPVWSVLNANGIATFPNLSGIQTLWIAVDHDPAGIAAADLCAERWRRAGREVFLVKATAERTDLNDIVREARHG